MTLGEFISKYRSEHNNMSIRAFARLTNLSPTYINNIERGTNNEGNRLSPTLLTYQRIADGLRIPLLELLLAVNDSVTINSEYTLEEQWIVSMYRRADEDDRTIVKAALRKYDDPYMEKEA